MIRNFIVNTWAIVWFICKIVLVPSAFLLFCLKALTKPNPAEYIIVEFDKNDIDLVTAIEGSIIIGLVEIALLVVIT